VLLVDEAGWVDIKGWSAAA